MSDTEEPPTKVTKFEMSQTFTQQEDMDVSHEEGQEEGQEEWLSEDLLTDDDTAVDQENNASQQDETTAESLEATAVRESNAKIDANIEQTLNSMDSHNGQSNDPFDELLKQDQNDKKVESDGNDTDDLLRMLEDDDKTKKVKVMTKTKPKQQAQENASSDEDDGAFIYQGTTVKKVRVAKNAVVQKYPTKAMPETTDDDETDASSEEVLMMQKMFGAKKTPATNQSAAKQPQKQQQPIRKFVPKKVVRVGNANTFKQAAETRPVASSTPLPRPAPTSLLKPTLQQPRGIPKFIIDKGQRPEAKKPQAEPEEIINEEEFLEEDEFDLDEDFAAESDTELEKRKVKQPIMRPEQMDEDVLSDAHTDSDDDSIYNELPSSDSDDMDEWFTLDIRAERAGDYLPLLGSKAYELLTQEKARVNTHISSLRHSLASLSAGSRQQADKLKAASHALAELDDALKAH